jgi:hypothetical protein
MKRRAKPRTPLVFKPSTTNSAEIRGGGAFGRLNSRRGAKRRQRRVRQRTPRAGTCLGGRSLTWGGEVTSAGGGLRGGSGLKGDLHLRKKGGVRLEKSKSKRCVRGGVKNYIRSEFEHFRRRCQNSNLPPSCGPSPPSAPPTKTLALSTPPPLSCHPLNRKVESTKYLHGRNAVAEIPKRHSAIVEARLLKFKKSLVRVQTKTT